jgi:hypothetical protein
MCNSYAKNTYPTAPTTAPSEALPPFQRDRLTTLRIENVVVESEIIHASE